MYFTVAAIKWRYFSLTHQRDPLPTTTNEITPKQVKNRAKYIFKTIDLMTI